jgi:predicted glycosyltransferase
MLNSLNADNSEIELEAAIIEAFRKYGQVYAKITRDKKNMPLAFVQFTVSNSHLDKFTTNFNSRSGLMLSAPRRMPREPSYLVVAFVSSGLMPTVSLNLYHLA